MTRHRRAIASALAIGLLVAGTPLAAGGDAETATTVPRFVEEAASAGIDHAYDGEWQFFVGGGVAAFDCDPDGRPDLFFAGGSEPAALYRNESAIGGALAFTQVTDAATDLTEVTGAYPLDIDADGNVDLAVLRLGENVLLRGLGGCRFERANEAWSFDGGDAWTTAFSASWESDDGLPTLAFGNYIDTGAEEQPACLDSALYRPDASGSGYGEPIALSPGWCTLSILFSDWDRSGRRDLRVSNDRHYYFENEGEEQLWRVAPDEPPRLYTREEGWELLQVWGMGIASQDLTGDGYPEVYLTSMADSKLQTLADGPTRPTYRNITLERGVTATHPFTGGDEALPSTAWHAEFQDVNNDGLMDLFIAKGNVDAMPDYAAKDPSNLFLGLADGTFAEAADTAGILSFARGRGAALVDFNLDGMLDLVEVNRAESARIWRQVGTGDAASPAPIGRWVAVRLQQPGGDRDGMGAWIEVRAGDVVQQRELTVGGGHAGGQLGWVHFGLGDAQAAEVRVQWPDGEVGEWQPVGVNGWSIIERGAAEPMPWQPPAS